MESPGKKSSLFRLATAFYHWKWFSVLVLALVGIIMILIAQILLYVHHEAKPTRDSFIYNLFLPTINTLGISILSGGIFTFLMKTAEYNDVFKKEIREVVLSEDVLLHKRDQLRRILLLEDGLDMTSESYRSEIWQRLTSTFYTNRLSGIKKELATNLYNRMIGPERFKSYHFQDLTMQYTIRKHDDSHIEIIEEQSVLLIKEVGEIEVHKEYYVWKLNKPEDKGELEVRSVSIDGQDMMDKVSEIAEKEVTSNGATYLVRGQKILIPLSDEKKQHRLRMILRVVHSMETLPYWRFVLGKFTNGSLSTLIMIRKIS